MHLKKKIFTIIIALIFISIFSTSYGLNYSDEFILNNNTDYELGCCSIALQLDGNNSIMTFRRDSDLDADIHIEQINWHGIPVIKQYKTDHKYFCHVIITNNGWTIGLGGIDDGIDNKRCENITATMITDDNSISQEGLKEIQEIKKPYGRGHVLIKAPNGNYGFATVDQLKTGKLKPGQYISIPNNYSCSRKGEISLNSDDLIEEMTQLARSDKYGEYRRDIITYNYHQDSNDNITDIYVSNEDGALIGQDYVGCADDIYFNTTSQPNANNYKHPEKGADDLILKTTLIKASDIPVAPNYKKISTLSFSKIDNSMTNQILQTEFLIPIIIGIIVFAGLLFFIIYRLVKFIAK